MRTDVRLCWALTISAMTACATPPPAHPEAAPGVVMGRLQIFADGSEITNACVVGLRGADKQMLEVHPDVAGWIYASMAPGKAEIATVGHDGITHRPGLEFHVAGDGRMTYFGHVRLELQLRPATGSSDAQHAVAEGMRAGGESIANMPNLSLGAAVGATAALSAVGVVAMALLSDGQEAGATIHEVEDKTYEAVAAYTTRYHKRPKDPSVSLAGSTFSGEPSLSPSVQKQGDLVYTEASLGGVRLTWLAVAKAEQRNAALRVQRFSRQDVTCSSIKLVLDGRERVVATMSKAVRASGAFRQTVQGEVDLEAVRDVASAKRVVIDVCGTTRAFSALAQGATINFSNAYQRVLASAAAPPLAATAVAEGVVAAAPAAEGAQPTGSSAPVVAATANAGEIAPQAAAATVGQ